MQKVTVWEDMPCNSETRINTHQMPSEVDSGGGRVQHCVTDSRFCPRLALERGGLSGAALKQRKQLGR